MQGYTTVATYTKFQDRMYHKADTQHQGPSVSLKAFHQGQRPAPLVTTQAPQTRRPARPVPQTFPCPDVGRLVAMLQAGESFPPLTRPQPTLNTLACETCHRVSGCRCGTPSLVTLAQQLDAALTQKQGPR